MTELNFLWDITSGERKTFGFRVNPGAVVEGTLILTAPVNLNCRKVKLRLGWHTEGRGSRDQKTIEEQVIHEDGLPGGKPVSLPFRMYVPAEPWSYTGYYINIIWELTVEIDLPLAENPKSSLPILVRPSVR